MILTVLYNNNHNKFLDIIQIESWYKELNV